MQVAAASPAAARPKARPITRIDRSAVFRLFWAVLAVALALFAQATLERRLFLGDGLAMLLVAGLVFARASRGLTLTTPIAEPVALPLSRLGLALVGVGVLVNAAGLLLFGTLKEPDNTAWLLYLGSIPVALAGVYLLDARPSLRNVLSRNRGALALLGIVLLAAIVMRFYRIGEIPFGVWSDEAFSGLEILRVLREPGYRPVAGAGQVQGLPAMAWYLSAPLVSLLGPTEVALRVPAATAGVAGVVGVFLLGRALFGTVHGVVAAGMLATMAWHVTFSRIAMHGVYSTALNAFSLAFLVYAVKTGRRSLFALSGLALGLSVNFYFAARLFLVVAAVYVGHHLVVAGLPWLRRHWLGLVLFGLFGLMAAGPLSLLAFQNPRLFNERTETVSVFREVEREGSYQPIVDNVRKHLLMFNVAGDSNGRHNLPGAPMLDRATAALAALGFVLALTRALRPEYLVLVAWLLTMMLGGILTLSFEAPQSYRTVDNTAAAALLAALPIAALAQRLGGLLGAARTRLGPWLLPTARLAAGCVAMLALIPIGYANVERYFVKQARDPGAWAAHATPETLIAREIQFDRIVGKPYVDQTLMDHPTIKLLAPQSFPNTRFDPATSLPFRDPQGATVFVNGEATAQVATVRRLYPDARVVEHRNPAGGPVVLYEVLVPPAAIARVQGADVTYWADAPGSGEPLARGRADGLGLPSADAAPPAAKTVEWRAILAAPEFGRYAFRIEGPADAVLRLNETDLLKGGEEAGATLARGNNALSLRAPVGATDLRLLWRTPTTAAYQPVPGHLLFTAPVTNNGLLGTYYRGTSWSGEPGLLQVDPSLQMRFHLLPLPRPYSVEWKGKIYVPQDGAYRFGASAIDESWIYIDERMVVDNSRNVGTYGEGGLVLNAGFHDIRVRYVDRTGHTYINVFWTPPGRAREPIPTEYLFPPQGSYPDKVVPPPVVGRPAEAPGPASVPTLPGAAPAAKPAAPAKPVAGRPGPATGAPVLSARTLLTVGAPGDGAGQFTQPRAAAMGKDGSIYVTDTNNKRIQKFGPSGDHQATFGDELIEPLGIVVDSAGRVLVLDSEPGWIKRYTPDGQLVDQFAGPEARFYHPRSLAIDAADNLYIADTGGGRVVKFNGKGEQVAVIGTRGQGQGQIMEPTGAAADALGNVWVADSANAKLVRFGSDGQPDVELSLPRSGSMHGPHVAASDTGNVYVTDPEGGKVYVVGSDGTVRGVIQPEELRRPLGIAVGPEGKIVVGDVTHHHVVVLAPPAP